MSIKTILNGLFFLFSISLFGQKLKPISLKNDRIYYNIINFENEIYIGSSDGIIKFNGENGQIHNKDIIGGIDRNLKRTIGWNQSFTDPANYNLDALNLTSKISYQKLGEYHYVVHENILYILKKYFFQFKNYPSIRAISDNYIGTYNGIYFDGEIQNNLPRFTNGKIKEFNDYVFICYNGLYVINNKNNKNSDIFNHNENKLIYKGENFGLAEDIFEFDYPNYILQTNLGLALFNVENLNLSWIKKGYYFADKPSQNTNNFSNNKILLTYNKNSISLENFYLQTSTEVFNSTKSIFKVFKISETWNEIIILYHDATIQYVKFSQSTIGENSNQIIWTKELNNNPHNLIVFFNYILISGNSGVSVIDIQTNKIYHNLIFEEFNRLAIHIKENEIYLGSINGLYHFSKSDLEDEIIKLNLNNKNIQKSLSNNYQLYFYLFSIIAFTIIIYLIYMLRKVNRKNATTITNQKAIIDYINNNIRQVTTQNIQDHFKIHYIKLCQILGDKPGSIITQKRLSIATSMKKKGVDIEKISEKTGYSISYLKKIKY